MTNLRVYVSKNNTATLVCPACGITKHVSVEKFSQSRHTIKAHCKCQHVLNIQLDFRQHYRKQISLTGTYEITSHGGIGGGLIHIHNLSKSGVGFTISGLHRIEKGQELLLEFQLNDKKKTVLTKRVVVKSALQNTIGCQFKEGPDLDKNLGFYLQG